MATTRLQVTEVEWDGVTEVDWSGCSVVNLTVLQKLGVYLTTLKQLASNKRLSHGFSV